MSESLTETIGYAGIVKSVEDAGQGLMGLVGLFRRGSDPVALLVGGSKKKGKSRKKKKENDLWRLW